jgi:predicted NBD/HSP70 family sugar kinase
MPGRQYKPVRGLGGGSQSAVLRDLYFAKVSSRQEIGTRTGLSPGTVSNAAAALIADGLVIEVGQVDSEGGRPRILLRVDPEYGYLVGVDVGETRVHVELFDLGMGAVATAVRPLRRGAYTPEIVAGAVLAGIEEVLAAGGAGKHVLGIGVGVPGIVAQGSQEVVHASTMGWVNVPLQHLLREGLRRAGTDLPLFVENGAKTMGQAELLFGAGRGAREAVLVLIGSGVGGCVIVDGVLHQGAGGSAGEWGHTTVSVGGRTCRCRARGCLEAYVGAEGILDRYHEALGFGHDTARSIERLLHDGEEASLRAMLDAAGSDLVARAVLDSTLTYLGAGLGNLINLLNPERMIIAGWAGLLLGDGRLDQIRDEIRQHALDQPFRQADVRLGALGSDAVAMGAAALVLEEFLNSRTTPRPETSEASPVKELESA